MFRRKGASGGHTEKEEFKKERDLPGRGGADDGPVPHAKFWEQGLRLILDRAPEQRPGPGGEGSIRFQTQFGPFPGTVSTEVAACYVLVMTLYLSVRPILLVVIMLSILWPLDN